VAIEIEMDVYFGLPNPRWTLLPDEAVHFQRMAATGQLPAVHITMDMTGKAGYRGMIVRATGADVATLAKAKLPPLFRVNSILAKGKPSSTEGWLLDRAAEWHPEFHDTPLVADRQTSMVNGRPATGLIGSAGDASLTRAACSVYLTPDLHLHNWNDHDAIRLNNNCYNFGSNHATGTFAQPGRKHPATYPGGVWKMPLNDTNVTKDEVLHGASLDGYKTTCNGNDAVCALVIAPINGHMPMGDYHWYRRTENINGQFRWSHKPGGGFAMNHDLIKGAWPPAESQNPITDPYPKCAPYNGTNETDLYTQWGGYVWNPNGHRTDNDIV